MQFETDKLILLKCKTMLMKSIFFYAILFFCVAGYAQQISSPDKKLNLRFWLGDKGEAFYALKYKQTEVIKASRLGFVLEGNDSLGCNFFISHTDSSKTDETWQTVWGEESQVRNCYQELEVTLEQKHIGRKMILRFRLFNNGMGFRYEFPLQKNLRNFIIDDEITQFALHGNHTAFWIPGDYDSNEYAYFTSKLSEIDAYKGRAENGIGTKAIAGADVVQTPLMMKTADGLYLHIFEAAVDNYPVMHVQLFKSDFCLKAHLTPDALNHKAYLKTPCNSPWRTVLVSERATDILSSRVILNLNEPSRLQDASWIKPMKYVGIWWEMHVGKATWNYSDTNHIDIQNTDWNSLKPNGKHGANTENTKKYIDFASKHGFDAVLVEGWNTGWEDWYGNWKEEVFDFVSPYPDFDVKVLQEYATSKNVKLIMHHETSSSVCNYERMADTAYRFMKKYGYPAVKTGYVGKIIPRGEHHDGQWMVNHYTRMAKKAANYRLMINMHESSRPTGMHRTWPNWLACEAARGNEFNAWSAGNPPEHETILPFTRLMGGPMDYTPGIFQIMLNEYKPQGSLQVHTTLAKQLALYVTMYSPLQMAADLPENYGKFPDAFEFIKKVPVDWEKSIVLDAEPGDYVTIARLAKNNTEWFLGSITDENPRQLKISFSFLNPQTVYVANVYCDSLKASWDKNPMAYMIEKVLVNSKTIFTLNMAAGGGTAIWFSPATKKEMKELKFYKLK